MFISCSNILKNSNYIRLIFRIFKYVYFMFKYVKEEDIKNDQFEKIQKMKTRKVKEKEKEKEKEAQNIDNANESEKPEEKEEVKKNKTIEISMNLIRLISNKANAFLDKNDIDQAVFEYYKNNDDFGKLFALMFVMDEIGILTNFSKYFSDRMDEFKEKKYIFDINGTIHDYSTEESQNRLREYVKASEIKYYSLIEGAYNYCINLKSIKIDDKRDNNKIIEDYENEDSDDDEEEKSKNSENIKINKEKNKVGLDDEISEEEDEISENKKEKNKLIENEKEKKDKEEEEDENNEEEEDDESKNEKKKGKNKINSKKKKAEELKPKYKKSQTYKNKKK